MSDTVPPADAIACFSPYTLAARLRAARDRLSTGNRDTCIRMVAGAARAFRARQTPNDGGYPHPRVVEDLLDGVAASSWDRCDDDLEFSLQKAIDYIDTMARAPEAHAPAAHTPAHPPEHTKVYVVRHAAHTTGTLYLDRAAAEAVIVALRAEDREDDGWYIVDLTLGQEYDLEDQLDL